MIWHSQGQLALFITHNTRNILYTQESETHTTMVAKNVARTVNLDDVDLGGDTGEMAGEGAFDQVVEFDKIKGAELFGPGEYYLRNKDVKLALAKTSGKPKFTITIEVLDGEQAGGFNYFDFPWAETAQARSKRTFVGMGLDESFTGSLREMAEALKGLQYYGVFDVEQSDGINERTQRPYDPKNRLVSTSPDPQTGG